MGDFKQVRKLTGDGFDKSVRGRRDGRIKLGVLGRQITSRAKKVDFDF